MANEEHLRLLRQGVAIWNAFRRANPTIRPDLRDAVLRPDLASSPNDPLRRAFIHQAYQPDADLGSINLRDVDLTGADLCETYLNLADLTNADLTRANLSSALLSEADLTDANLSYANFTGADLTGANLTNATLSGANFTGANLTDALLVDTIGTPEPPPS